MASDLRQAARNLLRNPRFTLVAAGSMALGIAGASAVFSFVHSILLAPLPFPASGRLVSVQEYVKERRVGANPLRMEDWVAAPAIEAVTGYYGENFTVHFGELPERVPGVRTFGDFFRTLNVQPAIGRAFTQVESQGRGGEVAVITDAAWRRHFRGDRSAVGRKILLNGRRTEIIGVLPPGAQLEDAEIMTPEPKPSFSRRARFLGQIARLRPGVGIETARREIETVASRLRRQYPDTDGEMVVRVVWLRDEIGSGARVPLLVLLGSVAFLVLMASLNLANLYLSKLAGRARELAVRQALGASRAALIRLLFAESALVVLTGGVLGLLGAVWAVDALVSFAPPDVPRLNEVKLDSSVIAFTALITLGCALLAGLLPAWRQTGAGMEGLKNGARGSRRPHEVQKLLVASQIALSLILTIGGSLLFRSLWSLEHRPLGFAPERLLSFRLALPWQTDPERLVSVYDGALERLRSIPGVEGAELTDRLPLDGDTQSSDVEIGNRSPGELAAGSKIGLRAVSAGFHALLHVPLRAGRYLEQSDGGVRRALINETAARIYFPGENPLGRSIGLRAVKPSKLHENLYEIVGVVADLPEKLGEDRQEAAMYVPFKRTFWPLAEFVIRTRQASSTIVPTVRRQIAAVDASLAVEQVATLDAYLSARKQTPRLEAWLVGVFAAVAMLLAGIGVFGLVSGTVEDRHKEIGIRMALGAESGEVVRMILLQGLGLAAVGLAVGLAGAEVATRVLGTLLFGVPATDGIAFAAGAGVLAVAVLIACYIPARRATRVDPLEALREE